MPVIPALRRLRQKNCQFETSLVPGLPGLHTEILSQKKPTGLGCSSVVAHLPSLHEALGSISVPKKKKQNNNKIKQKLMMTQYIGTNS
jgi:hypothetical protein